MKIKTSELTGKALDWAVAISTGAEVTLIRNIYRTWINGKLCAYSPSTDWEVCGQLIEEYSIELVNELLDCVLIWSANCNYVSDDYLDGQTPQTAICRAVVSSKLGDEVDIPDELLEAE